MPGTTPTAIDAEECWISIDGARMRYLRAGSGPPLVLVHGLLGYSFSWRFVMSSLAENATVFAPDLLGSGFSEDPVRSDGSLRFSAQQLLHFMDALGIAECDLLGTSRGGATVMMAAAMAPERVRRLILVAPVNPWSARGKRRAVVLSNVVVSELFVRVAPALRPLEAWVLRRLYADPCRITPGTLEGYAAAFRRRGTLANALGILRTWKQDLEELQSMLPKIREIPTLLIWGDRDVAVDPASAEPLRDCFRDVRLITLPNVGHLPYEEVPNEFLGQVLGFLNSNDEK